MEINVSSLHHREVIDITGKVSKQIEGSGLVNLFIKHTSACLAIADLDDSTDEDLLNALKLMTPKGQWNHPHNPSHFPDHLWSTIIGPGLTIPFSGGQLDLGTWQRIVLIELDGPKERTIIITLIQESRGS